MIPKDPDLRNDARLVALATVQKSIVETDASARDAALLMSNFVGDVIQRGGTPDEAWVMLFAAAGQIVRRLLDQRDASTEDQMAAIDALRREMLMETV